MKKISEKDEIRLVKLLCAKDMYDEWIACDKCTVDIPFGAWLHREIEKLDMEGKK